MLPQLHATAAPAAHLAGVCLHHSLPPAHPPPQEGACSLSRRIIVTCFVVITVIMGVGGIQYERGDEAAAWHISISGTQPGAHGKRWRWDADELVCHGRDVSLVVRRAFILAIIHSCIWRMAKAARTGMLRQQGAEEASRAFITATRSISLNGRSLINIARIFCGIVSAHVRCVSSGSYSTRRSSWDGYFPCLRTLFTFWLFYYRRAYYLAVPRCTSGYSMFLHFRRHNAAHYCAAAHRVFTIAPHATISTTFGTAHFTLAYRGLPCSFDRTRAITTRSRTSRRKRCLRTPANTSRPHHPRGFAGHLLLRLAFTAAYGAAALLAPARLGTQTDKWFACFHRWWGSVSYDGRRPGASHLHR